MHNDLIPELSVVVTVVDGGESLTRCLDALASQRAAPRMEVIIPFDRSISEIGALAETYPDFIFHDLGSLAENRPGNAFQEHELFDRRRAGGLREATGPLLAMIEDRGWPRPDWAREMVSLHQSKPHAAIGGAVVNAAPTAMLSAVFKCDFGRSEPPAETAERDYLTDINICYKREPLWAIRDLWLEEYHEVTVNWALQKNGGKLLFSSAPIVVQERMPRPLGELLSERLHWGRVFGRIRVDNTSRVRGMGFALTAPLLPFVLLYRIYGLHREKGRRMVDFLQEIPALFLLLTFWSMGEWMGYVEASFLRPSGTIQKIDHIPRPMCSRVIGYVSNGTRLALTSLP